MTKLHKQQYICMFFLRLFKQKKREERDNTHIKQHLAALKQD